MDKMRRLEMQLEEAARGLWRARSREAKARDALLAARREVRRTAEVSATAAGELFGVMAQMQALRQATKAAPAARAAKGPAS